LSPSDDILCNLFEFYLSNEAYLKIKNTNYWIDGDLTLLVPVRIKTEVTDDVVQQQKITIDSEIFSEVEFYLYKNGDLQSNDKYNLTIDSTSSFTIDWINKDLNPESGDLIITDFYVLGESTDSGQEFVPEELPFDGGS